MWAKQIFAPINGSDYYALFASQMSLIILKLVFNTLIPKEDHL